MSFRRHQPKTIKICVGGADPAVYPALMYFLPFPKQNIWFQSWLLLWTKDVEWVKVLNALDPLCLWQCFLILTVDAKLISFFITNVYNGVCVQMDFGKNDINNCQRWCPVSIHASNLEYTRRRMLSYQYYNQMRTRARFKLYPCTTSLELANRTHIHMIKCKPGSSHHILIIDGKGEKKHISQKSSQ